MKQITTHLLLLITCALTATSCYRPLEESFFESARLIVEVDWSRSGLNPDSDPEGNLYSSSIWIIARDDQQLHGKSYMIVPFQNPRGGEIELPVGRYSLVVHNNYCDPDQHVSDFSSHVAFALDGENPCETLGYYARSYTGGISRFANPQGLRPILPPDALSCWYQEEFEVTPGMVATSIRIDQGLVDAGQRHVIRATPVQTLYTCHVVAHVKNISCASACRAFLSGIGSMIAPVTNRTSGPAAGCPFMMNSRKFDAGSSTDGTIEATFFTFGPLTAEAQPVTLQLDFTLTGEYDGSLLYPTPPQTPLSFDVTQQYNSPDGRQITLVIDCVDLPRLIGKDMFDVVVDDWGDEQKTVIDM